MTATVTTTDRLRSVRLAHLAQDATCTGWHVQVWHVQVATGQGPPIDVETALFKRRFGDVLVTVIVTVDEPGARGEYFVGESQFTSIDGTSDYLRAALPDLAAIRIAFAIFELLT